MKRLRQVVLMVLVLGMVIGGCYMQCLAADSSAIQATKTDTVVAAVATPFLDFMASDVHQQNYLRYLVKEYDPDSLTQWEKAFADRKDVRQRLEQKLKDSAPDSPDFAGIITVTLADSAADSTTGMCITEVNKGSVKCTEDKVFVTTTSSCGQIGIQEKLYDDFEKDVELGDASAIKNDLPKILEGYKRLTEDMNKDFTINIEKKQ